ncbi:MAG: hypothetical protein MUF54_14225, partial [Polyangiaceae bacterium]|nr:hypothetical protein [Polyangiaceae bacterium]
MHASVLAELRPVGLLFPDFFTETTSSPPAGYATYSPVCKLEPEETTFSKPVTLSLPFKGPGQLASMFWSRPHSDGTTGYVWVGGSVTGTAVVAEVEHFSKGFVANGVEYSDPPDTSCVRSKLVEGRVVQPGGLAVFFAADDCWGRPITSFGTQDFVVREDGSALSAHSKRRMRIATQADLNPEAALHEPPGRASGPIAPP